MTASTKEAGWVRWLEIGLGIIVVILSIYALAYPAATFVSIVFLLGIILFIIGIMAGLTLTATALVFQFFSDRKKEFKNLTTELKVNI